MGSLKEKNILISGASIAGLSTAYWMNKAGYKVTVVEIAGQPRTAGTPVDLRGTAVNTARRMEMFEQIKSNRLCLELMEFKNAADITIGSILLKNTGAEVADDDIEIERDKFVHILYDELKNDVEFIFSNSITALNETKEEIKVSFKNGRQRAFHLLFGCDGIHSGIRKIWFGNEKGYIHFLGAYFSISIVNKLLIKENSAQRYNVPGKAIMLNAYNNKTDIVFCFLSEKEISYDYHDASQQRKIILEQFAGQSWRTNELLEEVQHSENFYFDKFCQVKMQSWTKGRVALVGDAGYCASPASGMGASLAIEGAAALTDALQKHSGNFESAFKEYNKNLRPFIEEIQAKAALNIKDNFIPATEEAIQKRNTQADPLH